MKKFYLILFFILTIGNIYAYRTIFANHVLKINVSEVGEKGVATLVLSPNGKTLLIDTGPDASILRTLGTFLSPWQRNIDVVVLTSEKPDAVKGLQDIINRYHISNVIHFGTADIPYGTRILFDNVNIDVLYAGIINISYGSTSLPVSSTTQKGVYISDGKIITETRK